MTLIVVILVLLLLLGGGGWYGYGRYGNNGLISVVGLVLIIVVVLFLTGTLNGLRAQQPVPNLKTAKPAPAQYEPTKPARQTATAPRSYQGAKSCAQVGNLITCDNGYTKQVK